MLYTTNRTLKQKVYSLKDLRSKRENSEEIVYDLISRRRQNITNIFIFFVPNVIVCNNHTRVTGTTTNLCGKKLIV